MLNVDGLVVRCQRAVLRTTERFLEFLGEAICVGCDGCNYLIDNLTIFSFGASVLYERPAAGVFG
jgi:hypothetical protein